MDAKRLLLAYATLVLASLVPACGLTACRSRSDDDLSTVTRRTLYVSSSGTCGAQTPCYTTLQEAVDAAASAGDLIKVAGGVYTSTVDQVLRIDRAVDLIGGYAPGEWSTACPEAHPVIVDAEQVPGRRAISINASDAPTITIRGFRIMRGGFQVPQGGGFHVAGGAVLLEDSIVEDCSADSRGGGVFIADGDVHLRDNVLRGNSAQYGGALYVQGGNVTLDRNVVLASEAPPLGGAIAVADGAVRGANNVVAENALAGAGVYLSGGTLKASHWTLVNNGRYAVIVDLGIQIETGSATIDNSIVASHQGGFCGSGAVAHQTLFHDVGNPCIAGASCVNNLFGDPKFTDPSSSNYHITAGSAAVDQAYSVDVGRDLDGGRRPVGRASDLGADELAPYAIHLPLVVHGIEANP